MMKTWLITGTSSGFGRLLTETLLARGDRVAATLRNVNALDALKASLGDRRWVAPLDVTDTQQGSSAYTSIRAALLDRLTALDAQSESALSTDVDV
jgi:NAD(P)-dependent dehydrogenase (short-subunit alcohol dehydrogenase family)